MGPLLKPSWGLLGPSWGHLGAILGHLVVILGLLGPSWGHLWAILGHLGPSWGFLGSSWAILGSSWAVLGRSWGYLGLLGALHAIVADADDDGECDAGDVRRFSGSPGEGKIEEHVGKTCAFASLFI